MALDESLHPEMKKMLYAASCHVAKKLGATDIETPSICYDGKLCFTGCTRKLFKTIPVYGEISIDIEDAHDFAFSDIEPIAGKLVKPKRFRACDNVESVFSKYPQNADIPWGEIAGNALLHLSTSTDVLYDTPKSVRLFCARMFVGKDEEAFATSIHYIDFPLRRMLRAAEKTLDRKTVISHGE